MTHEQNAARAMPNIAEMLIEVDRTAKDDADFRVKAAFVLEHARAELPTNTSGASSWNLLRELQFAAREFHQATQRRLNLQYALRADETVVNLLRAHIDAYQRWEQRLVEVLKLVDRATKA